MHLSDYLYILPEKNIALRPATPRDSSKLLVFDTAKNTISFDRFLNLDRYLSSSSFLVLNNTKVLPARVEMKKETGGKVIILFLVNIPSVIPSPVEGSIVPAMADRKIEVGKKLFFENGDFIEVLKQKRHIFELKYSFSTKQLYQLLKKYGSMPIPPYLKKTSLGRRDLFKKYQTIFAKIEGSAAAPTASLHFTDRVFEKLQKKDIGKYFVTLHVGLGTFAPVTEENIKEKRLHEEYFEVEKSVLRSINKSKKTGKKLVAVGTTVARTLESLSQSGLTGKTDLFIFPPFNFKMVDILVTNFHLPKSSLMMLVEAFLQYKGAKRGLVELYNIAIKNNFRFYSFGDAMLIL